MKLDYKIDETIIWILNDKRTIAKYVLPSSLYDEKTRMRKEKEEQRRKKRLQLHFGGILKALKKLGYQEISNRILSLHLKRLEDQKIIESSEFKPGLARYYWLTKNTKLALQLELPIKVKSERGEFLLWPEKQKDTDKNKKVYLLLLSLATIGFSVPKPVEDVLCPPLGAFYDNKQNKAFAASPPLPGISLRDFLHRQRDFANGWRFYYVKFKGTSEVAWHFQKLMEFEPPIISSILHIEWIKKERLEKNQEWPPSDVDEGKEKRYGIADKKLHEFLLYCVCLLSETELVMGHIWRYKRNPIPEEKEWYSYIYGELRSSSYFIEVIEERKRLEKKIGKTTSQRKRAKAAANTDYKACVEADDFQSSKYRSACEIQKHFAGIETIDRIRSSPYYWHQKLTSEEYKDVYSNYSIIADTLMNIAYPDFMKDIFKPEESHT